MDMSVFSIMGPESVLIKVDCLTFSTGDFHHGAGSILPPLHLATRGRLNLSVNVAKDLDIPDRRQLFPPSLFAWKYPFCLAASAAPFPHRVEKPSDISHLHNELFKYLFRGSHVNVQSNCKHMPQSDRPAGLFLHRDSLN